jgi:hypothetical protein
VAENQVGDFRASLWRNQAAVVTTDSPDNDGAAAQLSQYCADRFATLGGGK